jgi:hypothetical protein
MRNSMRRGLGPTLSRLHARIKSDVVLVHDGTSNIDVEEIRSLWLSGTRRLDSAPTTIADLRAASETHAAMQRAHQRLSGFQLMSSLVAGDSTTQAEATQLKPREADRRPGVGTIPPLPKSSIFSSISLFAMRE